MSNPTKVDVYYEVYVTVKDRTFDRRIRERTREYWEGITEEEALKLPGLSALFKVTIEREKIK